MATAKREKITTAAGRTLYRHSSGKGSVLEFTVKGKQIYLLILDAAYRFTAKWGMYNTASGLTGYPNQNINSNWCINGVSTDTAAIPDDFVITDAELDRLWATKIDTNTAKQNCNVWMKYTGVTTTGEDGVAIKGVPAVQQARSISVDGVVCDIPTINELQRVYAEAANIDSLDPTLTQVPEYTLWTGNPNGKWQLGGGGECMVLHDQRRLQLCDYP